MPAANAKPTFRNAVGYSMAQKYIAFSVQLGMSIVLARLLTPQETGVFSLAAACVAIGHLLRDFGVADYVISRKDASQMQLRAAFTVSVGLAWAVAGLLWLAAWPMALVYKEAELRNVMHVLSISFIILPFGSTAFALLSKEMRFARIFVLQTIATVASAIVTIVCAWRGLSSMSLAIGAVAANLCTIVLLLVVQPASVFLKPTLHGLSAVMRFGGALTAARMLEQISNRSGDFVVNGMLGFHDGGLLSKANSLTGSFHEFFNSAVLRVATPSFSRSDQSEADVRESYLQATVIVASVQWLFFPVLGIFAKEIVFILFGRGWLECVPVIQVTAAFSMLWAPFMLSTSILTARQAVAQQLRIQFFCTPVVLAALVLGALYNLVIVTLLVNIAMLLRLVLLDRAMRQVCGIGVEAVMRKLGSTAVLAAVVIAAGGAGRWLLLEWNLPPWAVLSSGVGGMIFLGAVLAWCMHHPLRAEVVRAWCRRSSR